MSEPYFDPVKILSAQARAIAAVDDGSMSDFEIWSALSSSALAFLLALGKHRRQKLHRDFVEGRAHE